MGNYIDKRNELDDLYQSQKWRRLRLEVAHEQMMKDSHHKLRDYFTGDLIIGTFVVHHKELATRENFFDKDNLVVVSIEEHNRITFRDGENKFDQEKKNNFDYLENSGSDLF